MSTGKNEMWEEICCLRSALLPFANKADQWEANNPLTHSLDRSDSRTITHRLIDFRNARAALQRLDRFADTTHVPDPSDASRSQQLARKALARELANNGAYAPTVCGIQDGTLERLFKISVPLIIRAMLAFRDADRGGEGERVAVPRTPTIDMMGAGIEEWGILDDCEAEVSRIWEAMVNAAPATPLLDDETVERKTAFLIALAEAGIDPDIQELLVAGNPLRGIAPGALDKALAAIRGLKGSAK